jgi:hypothetical protein
MSDAEGRGEDAAGLIVRRQGAERSGAYGEVFRVPDGSCVKVFKSKPEARRARESELLAYKLASGSPDLAKHTPARVRSVRIARVLDENGQDISRQFDLDFAIQRDFVDGVSQKVGQLAVSAIEELRGRFRQVGICTVDADAVTTPQGGIVLIDIAARSMCNGACPACDPG